MTEYKAVLSGNPDSTVPTHIVMVCVWEPGLGDEIVRIDTGIADGSKDIGDVQEIAEEKLSAAGWSIGAWEESGGDYYATATRLTEEEDENQDDAILDRFNPGRVATQEQRADWSTTCLAYRKLVDELLSVLPDNRERGQALTKLEEALSWSRSSIMRDR